MVSEKEGKLLVSIARKAIWEMLSIGKRVNVENKITEKAGVFVTLETYPEKELRGCIGFAEAHEKTEEMTVDAALYAAFEDSRFPQLKKEELERIIIDVSLLSEPKPIDCKKPQEIPKKIKAGRDGLTIDCNGKRGLLLPIVAAERNWSEDEFLGHVCMKAGLDENEWKKGNAKICTFETQIFAEKTPGGKAEEIKCEDILKRQRERNKK